MEPQVCHNKTPHRGEGFLGHVYEFVEWKVWNAFGTRTEELLRPNGKRNYRIPPFLFGLLFLGQIICFPVLLLTGNTLFSRELFSGSSEAM